jgi:hypothetical protein
MKIDICSTLAVLSLVLAPALQAEDKHKEPAHDHAAHAKKTAGPNGGRVITSTEPHFEFFVMPDGKVKITFLGEDGKATALKEQTVSAIGGDRAKPTKLSFVKEGDSLLSDQPLPEGKMIPIMLMVKITPDTKTVTEKFTVNLADCPECVHKEYACTCDHAH